MLARTRRGWWTGLVLLVGAVLVGTAAGDVLVTKSGSRYTGTVTDKGDSYLLVRAGGGKMTFPKSMVREVIASEDMTGEWERMRRGADLCDDAAVAKLASFCVRHGLTGAREKLLADAHAARLAKAKDSPESLLALAAWCGKNGLTAQAAQAAERANRLEFSKRLAEAGSDATALSRLAQWCSKAGLRPEAERAEAAALRAAPDDASVRKLLGYAKDPATGKWTKAPAAPAAPAGESKALRSFRPLPGPPGLTRKQAVTVALADLKSPLAIWIESRDKKTAQRTPHELAVAQVRSLVRLLERAESHQTAATESVVWSSFYRVPLEASLDCPPLAGALKLMGLSPPAAVSISLNAENRIWLISRCPGPMKYFLLKSKPAPAPPPKKDPPAPPRRSAFRIHTVYVSPVGPPRGRLRSVSKYTKIEIASEDFLHVFVTAPSAAEKEKLFRCRIQTADGKAVGTLHASADAAKFRPLRDTAGYEVHPALKQLKDEKALPRLNALFSGRAFKSKQDAALIFKGKYDAAALAHLRLVGEGIDLALKP